MAIYCENWKHFQVSIVFDIKTQIHVNLPLKERNLLDCLCIIRFYHFLCVINYVIFLVLLLKWWDRKWLLLYTIYIFSYTLYKLHPWTTTTINKLYILLYISFSYHLYIHLFIPAVFSFCSFFWFYFIIFYLFKYVKNFLKKKHWIKLN